VDESPFARIVSEHIDSKHIEITIHPQEITETLEDVVWSFDDLFGDWGLVSTRLLYKECREQGIKVVLVGEGSDEIFGGYPNFTSFTQYHLRSPFVWKLFQLYRDYAGRRFGRGFPKFYSFMKRYLRESNNDFFHSIRLFESCNQLPNNYVMKVDKASMAVSVEARTPYLDRRVVEVLFRTPPRFLLTNGTNKFLLRSMAERYKLLPKDITRRPKYGASMAISWMDESIQFREYAKNIILDGDSWVDALHLRNAMTDYFAGRRSGYSFPRSISIFRNVAWRLLLLNLWSRRYLN
jgi:asparagine synthase (glutamine-hydrolysing)